MTARKSAPATWTQRQRTKSDERRRVYPDGETPREVSVDVNEKTMI